MFHVKQSVVNIQSCPICGHAHFEDFRTVKDYSTSQEEFNIVSCKNCGFLFTNPRPTDEGIGRYYESDKYISHTNQKSGLFGKAYQVIRDRALKTKLKWITKHVATEDQPLLLDYGSGTGEFLNYCKTQGWAVRGLEIAEGPREQSRKSYGLDVGSPDELSKVESDSLDVITLWHVLEHVSDMNGLLETLTAKLKPGGILVLALPNPESYDAALYGEFWAAWDVPIHFYHFKKQDIAKLAKKHRLGLIETINMPFDAYYVSLLSEEYKTGKKNWLSATRNGFKSNRKGKHQNASSLTYILRKG